MKCTACEPGQTARGTATVTVERAGTTLVLKEVPAQVCETCGEEYLDAEVLSEIERLVEAAVETGVEVVVRDFPTSPLRSRAEQV